MPDMDSRSLQGREQLSFKVWKINGRSASFSTPVNSVELTLHKAHLKMKLQSDHKFETTLAGV